MMDFALAFEFAHIESSFVYSFFDVESALSVHLAFLESTLITISFITKLIFSIFTFFFPINKWSLIIFIFISISFEENFLPLPMRHEIGESSSIAISVVLTATATAIRHFASASR